MSSTPCKSLKKDGTPCRGNGLDQLDGYCIAHAPADKAWQWRSRGGKASSAAARADKRIPDRLRHAIDKVSRGMDQVLEGKLEPAALSAISRAAKVLIELYRLADHEMDLIRSEETAAAAAQVAGAAGDPELLDAAAAIAAWQDQYRIDALIDQGLVAPEPVETKDADQPQARVLTAAGRQRFGYQRLTKYTRRDIDVCRELVIDNPSEGHDMPVALYDLYFIRKNLNELLTDCAPASPPVVDAPDRPAPQPAAGRCHTRDRANRRPRPGRTGCSRPAGHAAACQQADPANRRPVRETLWRSVPL